MVDDRLRHRLVVSGVVQGVGFRPFVYALASKFGLSGSVGNDSTHIRWAQVPRSLANAFPSMRALW